MLKTEIKREWKVVMKLGRLQLIRKKLTHNKEIKTGAELLEITMSLEYCPKLLCKQGAQNTSPPREWKILNIVPVVFP